MGTSSVILTILERNDWGAYQHILDGLRRWEQYPLLLEMYAQLDYSALFESHIHGPGHIERTMCHGALCAQSEGLSPEDTRLLLYACSYHDVGRRDDSLDNEHGYRSSLRLAELTGCTGEELKILKGAVDAHARNEERLRPVVESYHPADLNRALTIATLLKDADGLDRVRIWDLDPSYLRRESSKARAGFALELYRRYQAATGGELVPDFVQMWKHIDANGDPVEL